MMIITGMHRSGTSLVARLFVEAGAEMGDPATFYRPDRWNPEGYFERPGVHAINMPLVNGALGPLAYFRLPSRAVVRRRARRMADQIAKVASRYRQAVLKDPRFCITLPAWRDAGAEVERVIVCLREPVSVAGSLRCRNRALSRHSYYLWREHNERLLDAARDLPVWFIHYRDLLSETTYDREAKGALDFFGVDSDQELRQRLRLAAVKPEMNHHPAVTASYPPRLERLWRDLLERHGGQFE